jgi:hypothetical protein
MTAHSKARKNRFGDLIAYSNHLHNHRRDCIAGAIVVVNMSEIYENPDPFAKGLRRAKFDMQKVVGDTIRLFAGLPLRTDVDEPSDQLEALGVIVVDYDGANSSKLVTERPAPQPGDSLHYDSFIHRIADLYETRFVSSKS